MFHLYWHKVLEKRTMGWGNSSAVTDTICASREPEFDSQHSMPTLITLCNSSPGKSKCPLLASGGTSYRVCTDTYANKTPTPIKINNLKIQKETTSTPNIISEFPKLAMYIYTSKMNGNSGCFCSVASWCWQSLVLFKCVCVRVCVVICTWVQELVEATRDSRTRWSWRHSWCHERPSVGTRLRTQALCKSSAHSW